MKICVYFFPALKHNIVIMKMKFITAIVAFSITFGFSTVLAGLLGENNETAQKISSLLKQDIANGQRMDQAYHLGWSSSQFARVVSDYVDQSQAIDDTNLPADFTIAWQAHMQAWNTHANFLSRSSCMKKKMTAEEISQITTEHKYEITTTWLDVLRIARKYDAVIPYNAY
jgi:hypothetical protein